MRRLGAHQLHPPSLLCTPNPHGGGPPTGRRSPVSIACCSAISTLPSCAVVDRAIAASQVGGAEHGLGLLDELSEPLDGYHLYHATPGDLLKRLGRHEEGRAANRRALELRANPAERSLLEGKLVF